MHCNTCTSRYQVIEAADLQLGCDLTRGEQWWPLGIVRSKTWRASPGWEQMPVESTPFVGGAAGNEPHVGCSIQYPLRKCALLAVPFTLRI